MNQLDQITQTIRQAVKQATNKNMSLQSAKALAAKVMGERNMHVAADKSQKSTTPVRDGFTWHVVGHYEDNHQPFTTLVRAKDGFSALLEVAHSAKLEAQAEDEEPQDTLILHSAINPFTGEIAFPSDDSAGGVYLSDLNEHLEDYEPFSQSHSDRPQADQTKIANQDGLLFVCVDADTPQQEEPAAGKLEEIFKRVDAMDHWQSDENYPAEDWNHEVSNGDTRLSYKEWVKNQYEMNFEEDDN